jgi:hypothetical protein
MVPYLGPEGYIYWCKGAFAEQTYEQPGKPPLVTKAAHIFRRKADGTGPVENVMTGGMDNPVDVVFTPGGERIFTTTFLQRPGGGLRDGLDPRGLRRRVRQGARRDELPPTDRRPDAAARAYGARCSVWPDSLRVGISSGMSSATTSLPASSICTRSRGTCCRTQGATFKTTDSDFVVSTNIDFHPTDVLEDADGSIVICDTGGWYRLCCPTSQLEKPDVIGAVYRVRRQGMKSVEDPRGLKLDWDKLSVTDLAKLLGDPRPAVQRRAIRDLAKQDAGKGGRSI